MSIQDDLNDDNELSIQEYEKLMYELEDLRLRKVRLPDTFTDKHQKRLLELKKIEDNWKIK